MLRREQYKDLDKYKKTKREQQKRYRIRTGAFKYKKRIYSREEDEMILAQDISDRELSEQIERSVGAIQKRRYVLRNADD